MSALAAGGKAAGLGVRLGLAIAVTVAGMAQAALADDAALTAVERKSIVASGLPKGAVVSVKPDMVVAIRSRGTVSAGGGVVEGITLQGEVTSPVAGQFLGYRSMRSTVNVDCVRRRDMVVKMTVFSEPRGKGVAVNRHVPGGWVQPSPDAYLADVIRSVCASMPRMASVAPPALGADEELEAEERPLRTSIDARAARSSILAVPAAEPPPPAAYPPRAQVIDETPQAPPPQVVAQAAPPPPVASRPPAPNPAAQKPAAPKPSKPGKVAVQVAAADSERQAKEALAKLRGRIAPPLSTQVTPVVVDGRTFHRALVVGFQTRAEAQAFCAPLKGGCFIR